MSRVAVLSKKNLAEKPYHQWLCDHQVVLFASKEDDYACQLTRKKETGYEKIYLFDHWKTTDLIVRTFAKEHQANPFSRVVALSESDQIRAADLRQQFNILGQNVFSAIAFRNKVVMKHYAKATHLAIPHFSEIKTVTDIYAFTDRHNLPYVVKPIDGSGSINVKILKTQVDIQDLVNLIQTQSLTIDSWLIEEFIDAPILIVDGWMLNGAIQQTTVSVYTQGCHAALHNKTALGVLHLDEEDPRYQAALNFTKKLLLALPYVPEARSFHCELFDHPEKSILLCEIACRTGGGRIHDMFKHKRHCQLDRISCLGQAGVSVVRNNHEMVSENVFGCILLPNPGRVLLKQPEACPIPGVIDFRIKAKPHQYILSAAKISECYADALFTAKSHHQLKNVYQQLNTWFEKEFIWQ